MAVGVWVLGGAIAVEQSAHRLARDAQSTGDGPNPEILGVGQPQYLGSPLREQIFASTHGLAP